VRSVVQEPGTAAYLGSFKLAQATSCSDFFDRAMSWKVPTHNLICGDDSGNIAMQVTGLTPDRDGWTGRLPVPGSGKYEWKGFRSDLPRELNPERGYIATANNNTTQPPGYTGRPVFYHTSRGVATSRITRIHQLLGTGAKLSVQDHQRIQHDAYSLQAEQDIPAFRGWASSDPDIEWARAQIAGWDRILARESTPGALYVRWAGIVDGAARDPSTPVAVRRRLAEVGLRATLDRLSAEYGADRSLWRYGRVHNSPLPHMFVAGYDLPTVERPGGFETVNATGANFRRIIDLSNLDNSVWSNSPGQSAQPGSPFYDNLRENLANGQYFPMLFTRQAVEGGAAFRLLLNPAD
jgi:penicillin amidase